MKFQKTDVETFLLIVADLLLLLAPEAAALGSSDSPYGGHSHRRHQHQPQSRQRSAYSTNGEDGDRTIVVKRTSAPCRPVPHEALWRKLDVVSSSATARRSLRRTRRMPPTGTFGGSERRLDEVGLGGNEILASEQQNDDYSRRPDDLGASAWKRPSAVERNTGDGHDNTDDEFSTIEQLLADFLETHSSFRRRRRRDGSASDGYKVAAGVSALLRSPEVEAGGDGVEEDMTSSIGGSVADPDELPSAEFRSRYRQMLQLRSGGLRMNDNRSSSSTSAAALLHQQQQCHLETYWKKMPEGTFPPYLETGRCRQTSCMFGLYECRPRRYSVKILRRLPRRCNSVLQQLATTTTTVANEQVSAADSGNESTKTTTVVINEEVWRFVEYPVIVGCECSMRRQAGTFDGGRGKRHSSSNSRDDGFDRDAKLVPTTKEHRDRT